MNERHKAILRLLSHDNKVSVLNLSTSLKVSGVTIRQDLRYLEEHGLLKKVHGGAVLNKSDRISNRMAFNYEEKVKIAQKAAEFVSDGETIFIESGSVNALLAKELIKKKKVTILTSNIYIARELRKNKEINILIMGGLYQNQSESLVGKLTSLCIKHVNFSKAFIGIDGFSPEAGFTSRDMLRAETTSAIVEKSKKTFVLTDSTKFDKVALTKICSTADIDCLITDGIPAEAKENLERNNIEVIVV
jgi:DeoR/GlpR family transcriptional regulator of sugar metabolism